MTNINKGIVVTSGVFDIFHAGHASLLKFCKELGEFVIVLLNSDESVEKSIGRLPILAQDLRKFTLESCRYVDKVIIFNEEEPLMQLQDIDAAILVLPGYREKVADKMKMTEKDVVEHYGGRVVFFPTPTINDSDGVPHRIIDQYIEEAIYARILREDKE